MSEDDLRYWIARGKSTTMDSETVTLDGGFAPDIVMLWNVVGELGQRVLDLEASLNDALELVAWRDDE